MEELLPHPTARRAALHFIQWLYANPGRPNSEIIQKFGLGLAWALLKGGYVTNPLGSYGNANTNLWELTETGKALVLENDNI